MKNNRGFSLLELLIVVAIILIITTIAIPSFLRSRQVANESAAVSAIKVLNTAEMSYSSALRGAFGTIRELVDGGHLDERYMAATAGYRFTVTLSGDRLEYTGYATASSSNDGRYDYYTTSDYVIRYSTVVTRAPAGLTGEPVR